MDEQNQNPQVKEAKFLSSHVHFPRVALVLVVTLVTAAIFSLIGFAWGGQVGNNQTSQKVLGASTAATPNVAGKLSYCITYDAWVDNGPNDRGLWYIGYPGSPNPGSGSPDIKANKCLKNIPQTVLDAFNKYFKPEDRQQALDVAYSWSKLDTNFSSGMGCVINCKQYLRGIFALTNDEVAGINAHDPAANIRQAAKLFYEFGGDADTCKKFYNYNRISFPVNGWTLLGHFYLTNDGNEFGAIGGEWAKVAMPYPKNLGCAIAFHDGVHPLFPSK